VRLLLDTHTFIWWDSNPAMLSPYALSLCQDTSNMLTLSVVSIWEMVIKQNLGKLTFAMRIQNIVENQIQQNGLEVLPMTLQHSLALEQLPPHHKDPFDRLLIAQAMSEGIALLSRDGVFSQYPVDVRW
jgi:PIN domain nuclease of toxin-antitoxin system